MLWVGFPHSCDQSARLRNSPKETNSAQLCIGSILIIQYHVVLFAQAAITLRNLAFWSEHIWIFLYLFHTKPAISIDNGLALKQAYIDCFCLEWDHFFLRQCGRIRGTEPNQSSLKVPWAWVTWHNDSASKIGSPSRQEAQAWLRAQAQIGWTHIQEGRLCFIWGTILYIYIISINAHL